MIFTRYFGNIGKTDQELEDEARAKEKYDAKTKAKVLKYYRNREKNYKKSEKAEAKAISRDENAKYTKWGKFRRALGSTTINPIAYYRSAFRENLGKEGFRNSYDFKTQKLQEKSQYAKGKAEFLDKRAQKLNDKRDAKGFKRIEDPYKHNEEHSSEDKPLTANEKAIKDNQSKLD